MLADDCPGKTIQNRAELFHPISEIFLVPDAIAFAGHSSLAAWHCCVAVAGGVLFGPCSG
jgi:hypothetical protein